MIRPITRVLVVAAAAPLALACSGAGAAGRTGDRPVGEGASAERSAVPAAAAPAGPAAAAPATAAPATAAPAVTHDFTLPAGRILELRMQTGLTSRTNHAGDPIVATAVRPSLSESGDTVIPAGAEFRGTVREIAAAKPHGQEARLLLAFSEVRIGEAVHPVHVRVTAMPTRQEGRGITGGTVAKVGAGAVAGGLAGRLIGGNTTGAIIGATAGAAAGGVYAHETRDLDIILPAGSVVHVTITALFERQIAVK